MNQSRVELSKAKSVYEWNAIRDTFKRQLTVEALAKIDGSGFIKEVSKLNNWKKK
tara:strand:+ start:135 stop:299 length:165 start_codon:yes stop_codon:yes gene_type:complete